MNKAARIALWIGAYGVMLFGLLVLGLFLPQLAKIGLVSLACWTAWQVWKPR